MKKMFVVLMAIFAIIGFVGLVGCPTDDEGGPTPPPPMATLSVSPSEVTEGETTTATVMLDNALAANARFTLVFGNTADGDDGDADVDGTVPDDASLSGGVTITAGDTSGTATITTVDDSEQEGDETFTVRLMAGPEGVTLSEGVVTVTITDTDSAGITVSGISGATDESGGTATFTVRLNTQPSANVVVTPTSSDTGEGTVSGALTFTAGNWGTEQTITVTGVDDSLVDGSQTYQISFAVASTDPNYSEFTLTPVEVTNSDDDYSATIVATTQAAEPSTDGVFTISLDRNAPTGGVTVDYDITGSATAGDDYATLPGSATIAAGSSTGTVVVDVTDDALDDDAETVVLTLTGGSAGTVIVGPSATATVTITDDDSAGITVSGISGATSESGETATFTVRLNTQPTADVTVTPTSSDVGEGTVSGALTFTATNWGTAQTITVTGVDDSLADDNQTYQISFAVASADGDYNGFTLTPVEVTNSDDDSAGITAVATDATTDESGGTATFTVRLNTQPTADVVVTPTSSDVGEGTVSGALTFTAANWGTAQTITVTGVNDSLVDGDQTYQISFAVASTDSDYDGFTLTPVDVTNSDDDYSATIVATTQAAEPSTDGVFTISLDRNAPTGGVTVDYGITGSATAGSDYAALPGSATIAAGSSTGTVVVDVTDDSIDDDAETVVLTLTGGSAGSGTVIVGPSATATVTITDDDMATATLSVTDGSLVEQAPDGSNGREAVFTLTLAAIPTDGADDVSVFFTMSGFAGTIGSQSTRETQLFTFATTTGSDVGVGPFIDDTTGAGRIELSQPDGSDDDIAVDGSATVEFLIRLQNDDGNTVDETITLTIDCIARSRTGQGQAGCTSAGASNILVAGSAVGGNGASVTGVEGRDYDTDNDGLIEVRSLAQLDAIRYDLDGDGAIGNGNYDAAYPEPIADMGCPSTCTGYELMNDLDFDTDGDGSTHTDGAGDADDAYYNGGSGWEPIGTLSDSYTATFEGNSNTIDNLFINRSSADYIGLFGGIASGEIKNIGVVDVYVTGGSIVGGLVGRSSSSSTISASYATGDVTGDVFVGGLVGENDGGSTISASYATGDVTGNNRVGGLVGSSRFSTISASYATGAVTGDFFVGGLVGESRFSSTISASYATGAVPGGGDVGGLVGGNDGTISASYATGAVTGDSGSSNVGGLVGENRGTISASYATGAVTGGNDVGGLVGFNHSSGTISASYATGDVTGEQQVGGLVGLSSSSSTISASYATGAVTGERQVGGLVGISFSSTISASYATGAVTGNSDVGGLVGDNRGTISASYSDSTTTGQSNPVGSNLGTLSDVSALTTAQLQSPVNYNGIYASWNVDIDNADGDNNAATGGDTPWHFAPSTEYPALLYDVDGNGSLDIFGPQR